MSNVDRAILTSQQRADVAEYQTRQTTLVEYIEACHEHVISMSNVETDKSLMSRRLIINLRYKYCLTGLSLEPGDGAADGYRF